ncbi:TMEM165/GDT1 family protein [Tsukamurella sp. 8F]|uniref:TMEM165/GDT1 family protein n=1 Tax=unclassified Tsukamurella TaxID=2633480 RepID=UPI0023B9880C|nr:MULTISPECIES: TMEM165/GDT1 family protein [unclassified Tsukamurella]MDF0532576.1 TMEM165/GDT1 family protein [Tsukamurella sp. 8J]MDF0589557.1 TMEM165/GDT1 family protein [Tsukamurella sp. 8F]
MLSAVLIGFGVVFVAEMGDKSQLMAMTFAIKHRWWVVLAGITAATALIQLVSVVVGGTLAAALPAGLMPVVAGLTMLAFAFWTWRGEGPDAEDSGDGPAARRGAFLMVTSSFLLAELGDRTMLATITLATQHDPVGIWIGSTIGMVLAGGMAIVVGALLGHRIPERALSIFATVLFFGFAVWMLVEAIAGLETTGPVVATVAGTIAISAVGLWAVRRAYRARAAAAATAAESSHGIPAR